MSEVWLKNPLLRCQTFFSGDIVTTLENFLFLFLCVRRSKLLELRNWQLREFAELVWNLMPSGLFSLKLLPETARTGFYGEPVKLTDTIVFRRESMFCNFGPESAETPPRTAGPNLWTVKEHSDLVPGKRINAFFWSNPCRPKWNSFFLYIFFPCFCYSISCVIPGRSIVFS